MTSREQYKSKWQQLVSEIARLEAESTEAYKALPKVPRESKEFQKAFGDYWSKICKPNKDMIESLQKEAEYCRIRSLERIYCNRHLYSDIQPYEVIEVLSDTRLRLRSMNYTMDSGCMKRLNESFKPGGFMGNFDNSVQEWVCSSDETGIVIEVRKHKDGHFYEANNCIPYVLSDKPRRFRDFNF